MRRAWDHATADLRTPLVQVDGGPHSAAGHRTLGLLRELASLAERFASVHAATPSDTTALALARVLRAVSVSTRSGGDWLEGAADGAKAFLRERNSDVIGAERPDDTEVLRQIMAGALRRGSDAATLAVRFIATIDNLPVLAAHVRIPLTVGGGRVSPRALQLVEQTFERMLHADGDAAANAGAVHSPPEPEQLVSAGLAALGM